MNKTSIKDYDIICLIGTGAFGQVHRAVKRDTKQKVAIKQYDTSKLKNDGHRIRALNAETSILKQLNHEGIMGFVDSIHSGNKVSVVVEYIDGSNLFQFIRKLPQ